MLWNMLFIGSNNPYDANFSDVNDNAGAKKNIPNNIPPITLINFIIPQKKS